MGYDLRIVRDTWEPGGADGGIGVEEWAAYLASDDSLSHEGVCEATLPDRTIVRVESEWLSQWTASIGIAPVWFDFLDGSVVCKNPDTFALAKLIEIADALGGTVVDDDGAVYGGVERSAVEPPSTGRSGTRRRWRWRRPAPKDGVREDP